ncbi:unnamed protein product [Brassica rapa subsp. narinosa]
MVSHEENVSIVEWFLGPPSYTYPPYGVELIHEEDQSLHHHHQSGEYYREYEDHHSSSDVDNDEIIARTLQDDFLQLQISENNGNYSNHHQHQQEEDYTHNYSSNNNEYGWNDQPTTRDYSSEWLGNDNDQDGSPNIYSCSSPSDTEEYVYSWESDQCDTDGEFGRRLNQMVPIPYVPKTNGEIPPEEEAVSDHDRLRNRLEMFDFAEVRVPGDGNCQFRALADQLYKTADRHKHVRKQIVKQLKASPDSYEGYVPMEFSDYLKKMSRSGEWGDHVTLQAAADAYRVKIVVLTSFKNTCYIEIIPTSQESKGVIFLSFWAEVHYNSIYLNKDPSPAIYIATTQNEPFNIPFLVNEVPWLTVGSWDRLLFHRRDKTRSGFSLLYPTQRHESRLRNWSNRRPDSLPRRLFNNPI